VGGVSLRARHASPRATVEPTPPKAPMSHKPTRRDAIRADGEERFRRVKGFSVTG
jgi:hypothetical protein